MSTSGLQEREKEKKRTRGRRKQPGSGPSFRLFPIISQKRRKGKKGKKRKGGNRCRELLNVGVRPENREKEGREEVTREGGGGQRGKNERALAGASNRSISFLLGPSVGSKEERREFDSPDSNDRKEMELWELSKGKGKKDKKAFRQGSNTFYTYERRPVYKGGGGKKKKGGKGEQLYSFLRRPLNRGEGVRGRKAGKTHYGTFSL